MSNLNDIAPDRIAAWCDGYADLCRRHGLHLVVSDDTCLQAADTDRDLTEAIDDMRQELSEPRRIYRGPPDRKFLPIFNEPRETHPEEPCTAPTPSI